MKKYLYEFKNTEAGNVLYMTVIMIMVLMMFTLVLTNVIKVAIVKIRAQQAADHMVLSVATLKARYLNIIADTNSIITLVYKHYGTQENPFTTNAEINLVKNFVLTKQAEMKAENTKYNYNIINSDILDKISVANGLDEVKTKINMGPLEISDIKDMLVNYTACFTISEVKPILQLPSHFEPVNNLAVQARVEWDLEDKIIGHKLLNISMPDIVTRARAEVYDTGVLKGPLGRYWKVRLIPPVDSIDEELRNYR